MPKIIIIPLSIYLENQQSKAQDAFVQLGVSRLALFWHYLPLPKFLASFRGPSLPILFSQYRRGEIDTIAFRDAIRNKFPNADLTDEKFAAAWNAMQVVTPVTAAAFTEIQALTKQNYTVYLYSNTNPEHIQDIKNKSGFDPLPGESYFSCEQKKLGHQLLTSLLEQIYQRNPGITSKDIAFFYKPATNPYPGWGWLAWLNPFAIVKNYEYLEAQKYYKTLMAASQGKHGFSIVNTNPQVTKKAGILDKINELWPTSELGLSSSATLTPLRDIQAETPQSMQHQNRVDEPNLRKRATAAGKK